jgi:hypothetical protein
MKREKGYARDGRFDQKQVDKTGIILLEIAENLR